MSALLDGLNPAQREAVLATEGPVLILAGAGSGKTRVIVHRIAHLVLDKGVPSERILAVTFTNKAADEMRSRVEALLGGSPRTWLLTFHSFCVRLLRREARAAALPPGFVIWDEDDQLAAVRQALKELDLNEKLHPPRRALARISARKNSGRALEEAAAESAGEALQARIAARYAAILERAGALDFDDLLLRGVALLEADAAVREGWRRRFPYVLVDEYQDTNRAQYELVRLLAGDSGNLTVVGDEDQSIYSWRGAELRNILDFERDFPGARLLRLEENYRSSQAILDAAAALVAHNVKRKGKTLRAMRTGGAPVRLHACSDEFEEAAFVVETIAARREGRSAILVRMNAQSRLLEEALLRARLPYVVIGGVSFYERREVRDLLAYLRLVLNPGDDAAFRRVLNVPPRGLGARTLAELERVAAERGLSLHGALDASVDEALLPARATQPLARFRALLQGLREDAARLTLKGLLERTLATSGYAAALAEENSHEAEARLENLAELLQAAVEFETRREAPGEADEAAGPQPLLAAFLDRMALLSDVDKSRGDAPVVLLTLHSAKGLEFDSVFLVGLEEGFLPHSRSLLDGDGIEEERRLCYVGMTRARERLVLTWAMSRGVFGQRRLQQRSRFLDEVPAELLEASGSHAPEAREAHWNDGQRNMRRDRFEAPTPAAAGVARLQVPSFPPGARVRHPLFGVGTVLRSEGSGDDLKLTVSFPAVGAKRLVARFAGLQPA
ncbi:MAG TPA: UvrD-helicase domain-containing protein [Vicinamibacteria bacterium]|nr:UvrD-helicase domain-containing protein [Vicinamibacteria bacterium]